MQNRPDVQSIETGAELRRWYWRKDELIAAAKYHRVKTTDGKFQILDRIAHFLDTGERSFPGDKKVKVTSSFDWKTAELSLDTVITDSYKNTQNVRSFFKENAHPAFKFNTPFMEWMKDNVGLTLADACEAYLASKAEQSMPGFQSEIKSHNQFNQFTRDFLADNPELGMKHVRQAWAEKIKLPSDDGRHVYDQDDLRLLNSKR